MDTIKTRKAEKASKKDEIRKSWEEAGIKMGHSPKENMQLLIFKSEAHMELYFERLNKRFSSPEKDIVKYSEKELVIIH